MTRQTRLWQSEDDEKMMSGKNLPLGEGQSAPQNRYS